MPETRKVENVLLRKEWHKDGQHKLTFWDLEMEGMDKPINIGLQPGNEVQPGSPLTFDLTGEEDRGKLKAKEPRQGGKGGGGFKQSPEQLRSENMRSVLHCAYQYVLGMKQAGEDVRSDHVDVLAKRWYGLVKAAAGDKL
jgi:hypothetical protein